jgi:hypothetical protein
MEIRNSGKETEGKDFTKKENSQGAPLLDWIAYRPFLGIGSLPFLHDGSGVPSSHS